MLPKCPHCDSKIDHYLVGKHEEDKSISYKKRFFIWPLMDEVTGKFIWKNLFRTDMMSWIFIILVILMTIGYVVDTKQCRNIIENPNEYCEPICYYDGRIKIEGDAVVVQPTFKPVD